MKKTLAILSVLAIAAVAQANVWNINWYITGAFSPNDTEGDFSTQLLDDYDVTWSLINGSTGDIIYSMSSVRGDGMIGFDDTDNGGAFAIYDESLMAADATYYLGSTDLTTAQNVYQYIYATDGVQAWEWKSSSVSVTPVSEATGAPVDIDADAVIGRQGVADANTYWQQAAVPEPATMSLLGLGALAMALRRKLRK